MEGEDASGHGGQEERKEEAKGERSPLPTALSVCIYLARGFSISFLPPNPFVRLSQEQKRCVESSTLQREVKKVRKARNRRQEWNMMAFDKELRPDRRHPQSLRGGASSEGSLSPDGRSVLILSPEVEMQTFEMSQTD